MGVSEVPRVRSLRCTGHPPLQEEAGIFNAAGWYLLRSPLQYLLALCSRSLRQLLRVLASY